METLFPVIFLGRAAENNVGQEACVHDMREMWSPYDQSCNLGDPPVKKLGDGFCLENEHKLTSVENEWT